MTANNDAAADVADVRPLRTSNQIGKLGKSLAKAQGEIRHAIEDSQNPHFRSSYASLTACWDACRAPLSRNGLSVVQGVSSDGRSVACTSRLLHESGEWIEATLCVPIGPKVNPQTIGSASTYAKRFGLCALVGVTPGDDDDAEQASESETVASNREPDPSPPKPNPKPKRTAKPAAAASSEWPAADRRAFMATIGESGWKYEELCGFLAYMDRPRPSGMSSDQRSALLRWMDTDLGKGKISDWLRSVEGGNDA